MTGVMRRAIILLGEASGGLYSENVAEKMTMNQFRANALLSQLRAVEIVGSMPVGDRVCWHLTAKGVALYRKMGFDA
ncbi:MAG TPA: hypothetical protein VGM94_00700 [Galbitalea sp.]|jgi:hypothetical protein